MKEFSSDFHPTSTGPETTPPMFHNLVDQADVKSWFEAATAAGDVSVSVLKNGGETYFTDEGYESTVPEGQVQVQVIGRDPVNGTGKFMKELDRVKSEQQDKSPETPAH